MTPGERAGSAVIHFLSKDIGRAIYLREKHLEAEDGSCLGCLTQMAPTAWPCILRQLADETIFRLIPLQRNGSP